MKKKIIITATIIIIGILAYFIIQVLQPSDSQGKNTIKETIETIASEDYMGRLVGTEGNEKTIEYITNFYETIGLDKYDDDYYYENTMTIYPPEQQIHELEVVFKDDTSKIYGYGEDYIDIESEGDHNVLGEITFDINNKDIGNKILVIDERKRDTPINKACFIISNTKYCQPV